MAGDITPNRGPYTPPGAAQPLIRSQLHPSGQAASVHQRTPKLMIWR